VHTVIANLSPKAGNAELPLISFTLHRLELCRCMRPWTSSPGCKLACSCTYLAPVPLQAQPCSVLCSCTQVVHFPRTEYDCKERYCNIEGVQFIDECASCLSSECHDLTALLACFCTSGRCTEPYVRLRIDRAWCCAVGAL
jgi:hypothetical protein